MKLYYAPGACSLAPHIALEEVGAPFELSRVDFGTNQQTSAEYLRINPKARVPALVDGDWVLTEAPAILRYIAARHPAAGLWPWEPREEARCAEWLNWLSSTIQIAFGHVRRAARYASDPRAVEDVATTGKKTAHRTLANRRPENRPRTVGDWRALQRRRRAADGLLALGPRTGARLRYGTRLPELDRTRATSRGPTGGTASVCQRRIEIAVLGIPAFEEKAPKQWRRAETSGVCPYKISIVLSGSCACRKSVGPPESAASAMCQRPACSCRG